MKQSSDFTIEQLASMSDQFFFNFLPGQMLNYVPPQVKNLCQSATILLISQWFASTSDGHFDLLIASNCSISFPFFPETSKL